MRRMPRSGGARVSLLLHFIFLAPTASVSRRCPVMAPAARTDWGHTLTHHSWHFPRTAVTTDFFNPTSFNTLWAQTILVSKRTAISFHNSTKNAEVRSDYGLSTISLKIPGDPMAVLWDFLFLKIFENRNIHENEQHSVEGVFHRNSTHSDVQLFGWVIPHDFLFNE